MSPLAASASALPPHDVPADAGLGSRLDFALTLATEAGGLAAHWFHRRDRLAPKAKQGPLDLVSEADHAVEALVRRRLAEDWPDDALLGEEGGLAGNPASGGLWVCDPIDGSVNFLRGHADWCVTLAYVAGGRVQLAVTHAPLRDEIWWARLGHGARHNGCALRLPEPTGSAVVGLGHSLRADPAAHADLVHHLLSQNWDYRRLGSGALSLALVSDGRLDAYYEPQMNPWDALAGLLLVHEAGGQVSNYPLEGGLKLCASVLASAPGLFPALSHLTRASQA